MKATGIVRRIDELGRVVIPKEIRRTQRIRRGDPLEIFTTGDGEVIFKKYSPMGDLQNFAVQMCDAIDCNLYFFNDKVSTPAMYVILAGSCAVLIAVYVIMNFMRRNKSAG